MTLIGRLQKQIFYIWEPVILELELQIRCLDALGACESDFSSQTLLVDAYAAILNKSDVPISILRQEVTYLSAKQGKYILHKIPAFTHPYPEGHFLNIALVRGGDRVVLNVTNITYSVVRSAVHCNILGGDFQMHDALNLALLSIQAFCYDPDYPRAPTNYNFTWSCTELGGATNCTDKFSTQFITLLNEHAQNLTFSSSRLVLNKYLNFTLFVQGANNSGYSSLIVYPVSGSVSALDL